MAAHNNGTILITSLIFSAFILLLITGPTHVFKNSKLEPRRVIERDCTTVLAPDLYGLGVRLGVYFQWFSAWIGNSFLADEIAGGLDTNAMYLSAILISAANSTINDKKMTLMDGLIVMWLCAGTTLSVLSLWGYRTCAYRKEGPRAISRFGGFGTHLRLFLTSAIAAYAIWYWSVAVVATGTDEEILLPFGIIGEDVNANCTNPEVRIFGYDVQGPARHFALILSIINGIYCAIQLLVLPLGPITRIWKMCLLWKKRSWASSTRVRFATGASDKVLKQASYILSILTFCWMCFTGIAIELILNENCQWGILGGNTPNNGNILTPGQLLPTIIGAFSFIKVCYVAFEKWRDPSGDISPSLGREKSRRGVQAKRSSRHGLNIFKMFSLGNAEDAESYKPIEDTSAGAELERFQRMSMIIRIVITIVPHISLFYSWPWVNRDEPWSQDNAEEELHLKAQEQDTEDNTSTAKRNRTVTWDREVSVQLEDRGVYDSHMEYRGQSPRDSSQQHYSSTRRTP